MTLEKVAEFFRLSRERVRQIEACALSKVRAMLRANLNARAARKPPKAAHDLRATNLVRRAAHG
jgi:hypothetical protein